MRDEIDQKYSALILGLDKNDPTLANAFTMRKSGLENVLKNFYRMFTKDMLMTFL